MYADFSIQTERSMRLWLPPILTLYNCHIYIRMIKRSTKICCHIMIEIYTFLQIRQRICHTDTLLTLRSGIFHNRTLSSCNRFQCIASIEVDVLIYVDKNALRIDIGTYTNHPFTYGPNLCLVDPMILFLSLRYSYGS